MKTHSAFLRSLLFAALGVPLWVACGVDNRNCPTCGPGEGNGGTGGSGGSSKASCTSPRPSLDDGGWELCDEGYSHRPKSVACPVRDPDATVEWPAGATGIGGAGGVGGTSNDSYTISKDECSRDSECGANEYCIVHQTNVTYLCGEDLDVTPDFERTCYPFGDQCVTDKDCADNQVCRCTFGGGQCEDIPTRDGCRTDADCPGDALCLWPYQCQLEEDECSSDADCGVDSSCGFIDDAHRRLCQPRTVCGR